MTTQKTQKTWNNLGDLRNLILRARQAYYHGSDAIMTDQEYDQLEDSLRTMSPQDPILNIIGAPVPDDTILQKVQHPEWSFMGSLFKVNSAVELDDWFRGLPGNGEGGLHCSLKGDGASMALYYVSGCLDKAVSRGDGVTGEDVTANAVKMKGVPYHLPVAFTGAVRCEVILTKENWKIIDPEMLTNPRNVGNGIMGRKNGDQSELLSVYAFDIVCDPHSDPLFSVTEESQKFTFLESYGFNTIDWCVAPSIKDAKVWFEKVDAKRDDLDFWIDGVVIRANDLNVQEAAGIRNNRPKGQRAWKFEAEVVTTQLQSVELSVGHTGNIIPTGVLTPVTIGGTTVSRVLLNNWEDIRRLEVKLGDTVRVIKANDIIPKIVGVAKTHPEGQPILEPEVCPCCNGKTDRNINTDGTKGAMTICTNTEDCDAQTKGKMKRWIKSLNMLGFGDAVLDALLEAGVDTIPALYRFDSLQRCALSLLVINKEKGIHLGEARATALLKEIDKTRKLTIPQFMGSLGVKFLGKRRVELMIKAAPELGTSLDLWLDGSLAGDLGNRAGVPEAGREIAEGIRRIKPMILELLGMISVTTIAVKTPVTHVQPEGGKKICISGKLPSGKTKKEYADPLAAKGHELVNNVSGTTNILVLADPDSNSSKAQKARKLNIKIINEEGLLRYV